MTNTIQKSRVCTSYTGICVYYAENKIIVDYNNHAIFKDEIADPDILFVRIAPDSSRFVLWTSSAIYMYTIYNCIQVVMEFKRPMTHVVDAVFVENDCLAIATDCSIAKYKITANNLSFMFTFGDPFFGNLNGVIQITRIMHNYEFRMLYVTFDSKILDSPKLVCCCTTNGVLSSQATINTKRSKEYELIMLDKENVALWYKSGMLSVFDSMTLRQKEDSRSPLDNMCHEMKLIDVPDEQSGRYGDANRYGIFKMSIFMLNQQHYFVSFLYADSWYIRRLPLLYGDRDYYFEFEGGIFKIHIDLPNLDVIFKSNTARLQTKDDKGNELFMPFSILKNGNVLSTMYSGIDKFEFSLFDAKCVLRVCEAPNMSIETGFNLITFFGRNDQEAKILLDRIHTTRVRHGYKDEGIINSIGLSNLHL